MSPDGFSGRRIQHGTHHFIKSLIGVSFQCALSIFIYQATPKTWNETPSGSESIEYETVVRHGFMVFNKTPHVSKTKWKIKPSTTVGKPGTGTNPDNTKIGSQSSASYVCKHWFPFPLSSGRCTRSRRRKVTQAMKYQRQGALEISFAILFFYRQSEWRPEN